MNPLHETRTVLIVDDEEQSREVLGQLLREEGYRVVAAASHHDAVALAAENHPDATVLEIDGDGMSTLSELCRHGEGGAVVVVTAHGTIESARNALLLDAHDYLTKPYNPDVLKCVLRNGVEHRARL